MLHKVLQEKLSARFPMPMIPRILWWLIVRTLMARRVRLRVSSRNRESVMLAKLLRKNVCDQLEITMSFSIRWVYGLAIVFLLQFAGCSAENHSGNNGLNRLREGSENQTWQDNVANNVAGSVVLPSSSVGGTSNVGLGIEYQQTTVNDPENPDECVAVSATAEPTNMAKVDIIWVIDASGSMWDETQRVAENINAFSEDIAAAAIDFRVVMITTLDPVPAGTPLPNSDNYLFVSGSVDSNNSLDILRDIYGQYRSFLRPDAVAHFIVLTDDESGYNQLSTPDDRSAAFQSDMQGLLGKSFYLHTISSEDTGGGVPCMGDAASCPFGLAIPGVCGAAAPGNTYYKLAAATGGLSVSICTADWSQVFEPLKAAVIDSVPLPCNYIIPPPPGSETLDTGKVNIEYKPLMGEEQVFPRVDSPDGCGENLAWYYDNPNAPTEVLLCEKACETVAAGGMIDIAFGCDVIILY